MEHTFFLLGELEPKLKALYSRIETEAKAAVLPFLEKEIEVESASPVDDLLDSLVGILWSEYKVQLIKLVGDFAENEIPWTSAHYNYAYDYLLKFTENEVEKKSKGLGYIP